MKRTIIQREVKALAEDLREISQMLQEEEKAAREVEKENAELIKKGKPLAPYAAIRRGDIKRSLEFVRKRLDSTIKVIELAEATKPVPLT